MFRKPALALALAAALAASGQAQQPASSLANLKTTAEATEFKSTSTYEDVVKFMFYVEDIKTRELINDPWVKRFPDPESRPSRHTMLALGGPAVRGELMAYIER